MIIGFFQVFDSRCSSSLLLLSLIEVLCTFDNDWSTFDNQLMSIDNHLCSFDNQLMSSYSTVTEVQFSSYYLSDHLGCLHLRRGQVLEQHRRDENESEQGDHPLLEGGTTEY